MLLDRDDETEAEELGEGLDEVELRRRRRAPMRLGDGGAPLQRVEEGDAAGRQPGRHDGEVGPGDEDVLPRQF